MDKDAGGNAEDSGWFARALSWAPRKLAELKAFVADVRGELKKVAWPPRNEVYSTTLVVILTTVFFGFYLYGLDLVLSQVQTVVFKSAL